MNKLIWIIASFALLIAFIVSIIGWQHIGKDMLTLADAKEKLLAINAQITDIKSLPDADLPNMNEVIWKINANVNAYQHQYDQKTVFKMIDLPEPYFLKHRSSDLTEQGIVISFYDLKDSDDVLRAIKALEKWQERFPIKIYQWDGFEHLLQVNAVLVAHKEVVS